MGSASFPQPTGFGKPAKALEFRRWYVGEANLSDNVVGLWGASLVMKPRAAVIVITAMLLLTTSCDRLKSSSESMLQTTTDTKPEQPVSQSWTFQADSARAQGPFTITLKVSGTGRKAPFLWSVTVINSSGSVLFRVEHDDHD